MFSLPAGNEKWCANEHSDEKTHHTSGYERYNKERVDVTEIDKSNHLEGDGRHKCCTA